jgi:hypothetical protein
VPEGRTLLSYGASQHIATSLWYISTTSFGDMVIAEAGAIYSNYIRPTIMIALMKPQRLL